jgi:hypothetical protein
MSNHALMEYANKVDDEELDKEESSSDDNMEGIAKL